MTMLAANTNSRLGASDALSGSSLDFDGRPTDWSAVAFGVEDQAEPLPIEQRIFCFAILVLAATPFAYVGGLAAVMLGR